MSTTILQQNIHYPFLQNNPMRHMEKNTVISNLQTRKLRQRELKKLLKVTQEFVVKLKLKLNSTGLHIEDKTLTTQHTASQSGQKDQEMLHR